MPMTLQFDGVNFSFQIVRDEEGNLQTVVLLLTDPSGILRAVIPFSSDGWENFKRQVVADGELPVIQLARDVNKVPKMEIPGSRR